MYCFFFYFVAAIALCTAFLPPEAQALFGGNVHLQKDGLYFFLSAACICFLIGVVLHIFFYRRDPERFNAPIFRKMAIWVAVVAGGMVVLSLILSHVTGLPPDALGRKSEFAFRWLYVQVSSLGALLVLLFFGYAYFAIKYGTGNRMARKLQAGDSAGAIRIAEARPPHKRDFPTTYNLAVAYVHAGDKAMARKLQTQIEQLREAPKHFTQESFEQCKDALRKLVEEGPAGSE